MWPSIGSSHFVTWHYITLSLGVWISCSPIDIAINIHKVKYVGFLLFSICRRNIQKSVLVCVCRKKPEWLQKLFLQRSSCICMCGGWKLVFSLFPSGCRGLSPQIAYSGSDEISSHSKSSPDFSDVYGDFSIFLFLLLPKLVVPFPQWEIVTIHVR